MPKGREIWSGEGPWVLEEDEAGALWLEVVYFQPLAANSARVRLNEADAKRCRKSRAAAARLAERVFRRKGRYP